MPLQDELTPLLWAANMGHVEVARLLIEKGAKIEAKDKVRRVWG